MVWVDGVTQEAPEQPGDKMKVPEGWWEERQDAKGPSHLSQRLTLLTIKYEINSVSTPLLTVSYIIPVLEGTFLCLLTLNQEEHTKQWDLCRMLWTTWELAQGSISPTLSHSSSVSATTCQNPQGPDSDVNSNSTPGEKLGSSGGAIRPGERAQD